MYRIDDTTAASSLPALPTDNIGTPGYFTGGNPGASPPVPPTRVRFWWLNLIQESLIALLTAAGLTPSKSDSTLVLQAISRIGNRPLAFTNSTTWTVPAGVYRIRCRVWGGGGGSGGTYGSGSASLGGGGGGYAEGNYSVTPGAVLTITVGTGGAAGVGGASPTNGGAGGTSSVGSLLSATGGVGGTAASSSVAPSAVSGGQGYGGTILNIAGESCSGPFAVSGGVVTSAGGGSFGGLGAHLGSSGVSAAGVPGLFPGGGAAGSAAQANGAAGAGGLVTIEY